MKPYSSFSLTFSDATSLVKNRNNTLSVAVAGADDDAVLGAVAAGLAAGIGFFLVGNVKNILKTAGEQGINLGKANLVDSGQADEASICRTTVGLCAEGKAGVLMKGLVGTSAFTRAVLDKELGLTSKGSLLSHTGLFADPRNGRKFLLTDAAINITPDLGVKKKILTNVVGVARALGIDEPRIALLAPVEKVSPKIQSTMESAELKIWLNGGALGRVVADGPFALDVAASKEAAKIKGLDSAVAGRADIYLVPNLDAGNIFYKSLTVFSGAQSAGILSGAGVPVVLTSRADSQEVKIASLGFALQVAFAKAGL